MCSVAGRAVGQRQLFRVASPTDCGTQGGSSFFFNDPATTEIYSLPLHAPLPIFINAASLVERLGLALRRFGREVLRQAGEDRKSTRLNSSHRCISYAVFCLK